MTERAREQSPRSEGRSLLSKPRFLVCASAFAAPTISTTG